MEGEGNIYNSSVKMKTNQLIKIKLGYESIRK